jgi:exonuclease SbcC
LYDAGDVRRLRSTLPLYWDIRESTPRLEVDIDTDKTEHARLEIEIQAINNRLQSRLTEIGVQFIPSTSDTELARALESSPEEAELQRLARLRRDIIVTRDQWRTLQTPLDAAVRDSAEHAMAEANARLLGSTPGNRQPARCSRNFSPPSENSSPICRHLYPLAQSERVRWPCRRSAPS